MLSHHPRRLLLATFLSVASLVGLTGGAQAAIFTVNDTRDLDDAGEVRARRGKAKVRLFFASTSAGATFRCSVDRKPEKTCRSPLAVTVKPGKHSIAVTAVRDGLRDPSPAMVRFKVVR